jgi:N-dimethylarginine dimethylaminohydrolase
MNYASLNNGEIVRAANLRDVREQLQAQGYVIYGSSPGQLTEAIGDGLTCLGRITREANIKVECLGKH